MRYFDCNATMPLCEPARQAWLEAQGNYWYNASSPYSNASRVAIKLREAREDFAQWFGCETEELVFCSGATEANNAVLRYMASLHPKGSVLISSVEHPSVREAARSFFGERMQEIPVDGSGRVQIETVQTLLKERRPVLCCVMAANNETGVLQPWREIAACCREAGVPYACDAVQWAGKMSDHELGQCDFFSICAHKFAGPKGVGILRIPLAYRGLRMALGGAQENDQRGGTEDVPAILAMHAAYAHAMRFVEREGCERPRQAFEKQVCVSMPQAQVLGVEAPRLWNTSLLVLPGAENHRWVSLLDRRGFCVSTGSACATGKSDPSHVLASMQVSVQAQRQVIRVSSSWEQGEGDWQALASALEAVRDEIAVEGASDSDVIDLADL